MYDINSFNNHLVYFTELYNFRKENKLFSSVSMLYNSDVQEIHDHEHHPVNQHNFHIVDPSPWPLYASLGALALTTGSVGSFHFYKDSEYVALCGFFIVAITAALWWRDIIREGTYLGFHTSVVQTGLKIGMILFIVSEIMFFFAFFWAFFHSSLAPAIEIGSIWPPYGINVFCPWEVPLLNTSILLLSGFTITWAHFAIVLGNRPQGLLSIYVTLCLAFLFTALQVCEYLEADFNISDSIYGSVFYMATGFHGFHVIVGSIFILVCLYRQYEFHFSKRHHVGFECAAWYWHFVDVVWLFLFVSIYWWGNSLETPHYMDNISF